MDPRLSVEADDSRDFIYKLVELRRTGELPVIDPLFRINPIRPDSIEASRVLDYARRVGPPPAIIRGVKWEGLFIEYALVAEGPGLEREAA